MDTTTQTRMKMEPLSNELFRLSGCKQGDAETFVYCVRKRRNSRGSMRPWFHLNPPA